MRRSHVLPSVAALASEFERCCRKYGSLSIAVAWCGNPKHVVPFQQLADFDGKVKALVGTAFNQTHPDAIKWLGDIDADIRIFRDQAELFHPKVYLFREGERYALFVGSSNFTYAGFYANCEVNTLIEGTGGPKDLVALESLLAKWNTDAFSFAPTPQWLAGYRRAYDASLRRQRKHAIRTPQRSEEEISTASWLRHADWDIYYKKVLAGLKQPEGRGQGYHDVLDAAARELALPWSTAYFRDIERRRIMGGIKEYGWLGHVGASGQFRSLLASGKPAQWSAIVASMNAVAKLQPPIPWGQLKQQLDRLVGLGPTMKVWGRLVCLVRPDLYCTVASVSVRKNLSETLDVPQGRFDLPDGYVQLIRLIHSSPWFNSGKPKSKDQAAIWRRRSAFLDAIFY